MHTIFATLFSLTYFAMQCTQIQYLPCKWLPLARCLLFLSLLSIMNGFTFFSLSLLGLTLVGNYEKKCRNQWNSNFLRICHSENESPRCHRTYYSCILLRSLRVGKQSSLNVRIRHEEVRHFIFIFH